MNRIAQAYIAACSTELDALKPGNVHRFSEGHGMTVADFETSARVSAPEIARPGARVGARVLAAIAATRAAVGQNTNLGVVLLCAPLAAAAERRDFDLRAGVAGVLSELDEGDAAAVFEAIVLAAPGGLGATDQHDVRRPPTAPLRDAMAAAADRDLVARQYANDFADVFGLGATTHARALERGLDQADAALAVYLAFLAEHPDLHIARKSGREVAEAVRWDAAVRGARLAELADRHERVAALAAWDVDLKARGLNPGTSADLTVATVFAASLTTNDLRRQRNND